VIIDDEAHIRDTLVRLLESCCPQVSVVREASGVADGIKAIKELHPDLILLDINMKDGTGFDLIRAFPEINFKVIFISAFDKNTIRAFKLSGLEYLTKPVNPEEIADAIKRVMNLEFKYFASQFQALEMNIRGVKANRTASGL
jgi:two-component system, LytTR family, response regulator